MTVVDYTRWRSTFPAYALECMDETTAEVLAVEERRKPKPKPRPGYGGKR